jgi:hypothetical protein
VELQLAAAIGVILLLCGIIIYAVRRSGPNLSDLTEAYNSLSKRVRELEAEGTADRAQIRNLEKRIQGSVRILSLLGDGLRALSHQIIEAGDLPRWTPPKEAEGWLNGSPAVHDELDTNGLAVAAHQILWKSFSYDELAQLCFEAGINTEDLPGGHQARAREMVLVFKREWRLPELVEMIKVKRPHVPWPIMDD